jgi:hypothetical protein
VELEVWAGGRFAGGGSLQCVLIVSIHILIHQFRKSCVTFLHSITTLAEGRRAIKRAIKKGPVYFSTYIFLDR